MPIAILYEHPEWFLPLFATLERRGIPYVRIDAGRLRWEPHVQPRFSLLVNRMSPSAYVRGHGHAIHAAASFLGYVEARGIPVVNGLEAYRLEISKSAQLDLFERLRVPYPRAHVINHAGAAVAAARDLRFPIIVKPNIGGSGARIQRFDTLDGLTAAADRGRLDLGIDSTALVQELVPARGGAIIRIELLAGELLYAIRIVPPANHGFNLCPADICQEESAVDQPQAPPIDRACPTKPGMFIEATTVPQDVLQTAVAIARAGRLDVCGIEYLVDDRDGRPCFYDVNALSNFVTDAPRVVGFDPFEHFVDYLQERRLAAPAALAGAAHPIGAPA